MLIIAGTIRIEKPATEEVLEACRNMMEATHEEEGCIDYVFSVDPLDPKVLRVFERWETQEALNDHFLASHMNPFREAMAGWGVEGMDILKFDVESFDRMR
ncbi:MAG: antibiotic biosynthesis monooxygenase [Acidimicrobiales bacterium]|jgi:quinol monooxygenase YgiN|nr:antibiotic biosynthesis monooxygenase [Acidimicrobiales bacterium]|tara:strand:+ start:328 stop:630 length:303 start_codon:yes stop_codon:yes gene_type:complete